MRWCWAVNWLWMCVGSVLPMVMSARRTRPCVCFRRQQRKDDALGTLMTLDPTDEDGFLGASRALRCEAPGAWQDDLLQLLQGDQPHLTRVLAPVVGFRRFPLEQALKTKLAGTAVGRARRCSVGAWARREPRVSAVALAVACQ